MFVFFAINQAFFFFVFAQSMFFFKTTTKLYFWIMQQRGTKWTAYYASNNIWQFNFHAALSSANQHWSPQHFGCSGTSGTFVMAFFFLCRARAGTNRTDPPLSVRNRWMGESGQACPASHYHFLNKSFFFLLFFFTWRDSSQRRGRKVRDTRRL